jgi:GT2 family glycosyltransferase
VINIDSQEAAPTFRDVKPKEIVAVVAICTKDRPERLAVACEAIVRDRPDSQIVVIDASAGEDTEVFCSLFPKSHSRAAIHYHPALRPGLARQRNQAVEVCAKLGASLIHFIDDDCEILPGYQDAIESRFTRDPTLAGVGGKLDQAPKEFHPWFNSFFLLSGKYPHTVRRSGRVVSPQPADGAKRKLDSRPIMWLQGFAMSYSMNTLREHSFDERLLGYSFGEDRDFGFRVSRTAKLAVEPTAHCLHHRASENRLNQRQYGFETTALTYAWVIEHRHDGLWPPAFFWSVFGDLLRHVASAALSNSTERRHEIAFVQGIVRGLIAILRHEDLYASQVVTQKLSI